MRELVSLWALKNLGFFLPPLLPLVSHHRCPWQSMEWPAAPSTTIPLPETSIRGPAHSLYPNVVFPEKTT